MKTLYSIIFLTFLALFLAVPGTNAATANLSWTPPTTYTDGTPVVVAGYKMRMGTTSGLYTNIQTLSAGNTYQWLNLANNTDYYFVVSALDAAGNESAVSSEAHYKYVPPVQTFVITASADVNGTITPSGAVTIASGANQVFNIAPASGYVVNDVTVDGQSVGAVKTYTFSAVTTNRVISATFKVAPPVPPAAFVSSTTWMNKAVTSQIGLFIAEFDAIPNAASIDAVTVFSNGPATAYSNGAVIVRFNNTNTIDCVKGSGYVSDVKVSYVAGTNYHFKVVVNMLKHVYDVYVTPAGSSEIYLAYNYAFRTEQAAVTTLNNIGIMASTGSHAINNYKVSYPPMPPTSLIAQ